MTHTSTHTALSHSRVTRVSRNVGGKKRFWADAKSDMCRTTINPKVLSHNER